MVVWNVERVRAAARCSLLMLLSTSIAFAQDQDAREKLRAHGEQEFRKDIVTVADGVYVAVGYSMANVTMIVGESGTIIVDTTSKIDDAQAVKAEFAKTGGASVFAGADRPEIYSHQLLMDRVPDLGRAGRDGGKTRSARCGYITSTLSDCSLLICCPKGEATGGVRVAVHGDGSRHRRSRNSSHIFAVPQQGAQEPTVHVRPETQSWGAWAIA